jgi:hypothetical protein
MSKAQSTTQVIYKPIPNFPGYRVGSDGSTWSCWKRGPKPIITDQWRILKQAINTTTGCRFVTLARDRVHYNFLVHCLVLEAFVGPRPNGMQGCHFPNQNYSDNRLENLRWDTPAGNWGDRIANGTAPPGTNPSYVVVTETMVRSIRADFASGIKQHILRKKHGLSTNVVNRIIKRKTWKHII